MKHLQVGLLSSNQEAREFVAKSWGNKSTTSDISIYTVQNNGYLQTTILPEAFPRKILSMVTTGHMSDLLIYGVGKSGINKAMGEVALFCDTLNIPGIRAVIGNDAVGLELHHEQMKKTFAKLNVSSWEELMITTSQESSITRDKLYSLFEQHPRKDGEYLAIEVDHAFPVQGVGSVILGTIVSGTVTKGQKIKVYPSSQTGQVRSIQLNDTDVKEASIGMHVGLAMKGILPKYLERGTVITAVDDDQVSEVTEIEFKIKKAAFGKATPINTKIHLVSGLYNSPGELLEWNGRVKLKLDKPTPVHPLARTTLLNLNAKPNILGSKIIDY